VLVAGGNGSSGLLSSAEVYDPGKRTWANTGPLNLARTYHTATVLLDGKVLVTAGQAGDPNSSNTFSAELYEPGVVSNPSWRPQIASVNSPVGIGSSLALTGSGFRGISEASGGNSSQDSAADYPLVQLRSLATGQTLFLRPLNWTATTFASAPITGFPVGYALATVFVNGIPSASSPLLVGVPPLSWSSTTNLPNGASQSTFTNLPGFGFSVLASTNIMLPATDWTWLGGATETSPGQYQYTDLQATNFPFRFYRIRWP
jgi:hypothetical protein